MDAEIGSESAEFEKNHGQVVHEQERVDEGRAEGDDRRVVVDLD